MKAFVNVVILISTIWTVSVKSDTSYQPQPASGGPYPASGVPESSGYKASGWKPNGNQFLLSSKQTAQATRMFSKGTTGFTSETEYPTVEPVTSPKPEPESENLNEFSNEERIPDSGTYYVLLPDGRLQKVSYSTMPLEERIGKLEAEASSKDQTLNGYLANIKYQDVEPIRGPIYAYNSAPLIRIFK